MKKIIILLTAVVMVISLAACGRRNDTNKMPVTEPNNDTILPETNPDMPQNIPDPEVDSNSTEHDNSPLDGDMNGNQNDILDPNDQNDSNMTDNTETKDEIIKDKEDMHK